MGATASEAESKHQAIAELLDKSNHDGDYYVLLLGAIALAACAIFTDSLAVLIGSMIVAPLAYPILALGLGLVAGNPRLIGRGLALLLLSIGIGLAIAGCATLMFGDGRVVPHYIMFNSDRAIAVVVALVSGAIAAYGLIRPKVSSAITGVAIAVSLVPPLVATGINFAAGDIATEQGALVIFLLNVGGVLVGSMCVFALCGMGAAYRAYTRQQE